MHLAPPAPIALLEDDPSGAFFVRLAVEKAGISNPVVIYASGAEARAHIAAQTDSPSDVPPILFIIDILLAGQETGIDFLRWLRTQPSPLGTTPAMMLSASEDLWQHQETGRLGASIFLQKPVQEQTLTETVQRLGYVIVTKEKEGVRRYIERPLART